MARPKVHADSAARRAAHLAERDRFDLVVPKHMGATIRELAEEFGASNNEVLVDLVRFALTNRNWRQGGLLWTVTGDKKTPV
jgi:hypothetical protein